MGIETPLVRIATLQRRMKHLDEQLADPARSDRAKGFIREERLALEDAIKALRLYYDEEDVGVTAVLRELTACVDMGVDPTSAMAKAVAVLERRANV